YRTNTGPSNNLTARMFALKLAPEALVEAARIAAGSGARVGTAPGESLEAFIGRLSPMFFDAAFDPMVTCKTPGPGRDILQASANNLYEGVTMADLEGAVERYPLNSRLVKRNGTLVEEVYRIGGRYDAEPRRVTSHLIDALPYAAPSLAHPARALPRPPATCRRRPR